MGSRVAAAGFGGLAGPQNNQAVTKFDVADGGVAAFRATCAVIAGATAAWVALVVTAFFKRKSTFYMVLTKTDEATAGSAPIRRRPSGTITPATPVPSP